jgi:hypothetical protein
MKIVGRYEILREIGRGGMATVYLARQIDLDRQVALKELGALRAEDPSFVRRFLREAQLAGSLSHPNIVTVHDYFEYEGVPYIAMEYVERGSVRPHVGNMSLAQIGGVLRDVLAGLGAAERRNIVHRDLKPENLMVTSEGRIKIADFGIAKATNKLQTSAFLTATGIAVGTPNYISPEQARGKEVGPWTDLYATGVMAFEFFVGKAPFADTEEPMAVLLRHVNERIPAVSQLDPDVDPRISQWVEWLVSKEPADRPQAAADAWEELEETLVSMLGPRWDREASLLEPGVRRAARSRPHPTPPAAPAVEAAAAATSSERPTAPLADPLAATAAPTPRMAPAAPPVSPVPAKRRWRRGVIALVAGVAVVATIAAALSSSGSGGGASQPSAPAPDQTSALRDLQSTPSPSTKAALSERAKSARRLARQYDRTASRIEALGSTSGSNAALVTALRQTERAYTMAAAAAASGNEAAYAAAIAAAAGGKAAVEKALGDGSATTPGANSAPSTTGSAPNPSSDAGGNDEQSDDPSDDEGEGSGEP